MSLAEKRGISLNIDYALPAQFLWKIVRILVNKGNEVEQAPFSRGAMSWRIYQLLAEKRVCEDKDFLSVTHYWQDNSSCISTEDKVKFTHQEALKRYQLACQLADLFEQYLVFRPDWIDAWGKDVDNKLNQSLPNQSTFSNHFCEIEKWQAKLWRLLTEKQDYNPINLLQEAQANLSNFKYLLPKRLCFFGINAMAPMWLSFINALSDVIDVHFFHLNPCENYWGDILSEKQAIKNSDKWVKRSSTIK